MADVKLRDVKKNYGDLTVIEKLNLDIEDQEFMVLVGPSGCGKSTALRMVAGLEEITDGEISIADRVVNDLPPKERDIAMVFQSYALYPHMSVRQNLEFGLKLRKMPQDEIDRRVQSAAEILGITEFLDRKPRALSGGQRQRVAVGRAIVRNPSVFLFDEPLSNLDAKLRVQMRAEISKLQKRLKTTTVYVTHDQVEAMTMGDRIAILKDGDLMQVGTPLDVYERPANSFVAGFIGTPPMNLVDAVADVESLKGDGFEFRLTEGLKSMVGSDERKLIVGIRPEHLHLSAEDLEGAVGSLAADVEVVEPLGHENIVHGKVAGDFITATVPPAMAPTVGDRVEFLVELDRLHLFDAETEKSLVV
ncbi:MAG: sn-glycerol-3-phosphate ABC transporter ATP-binding protein UgpC [bacterium]|nr:sn-glycerol-3-phosphate ABC transporter ATP-binding protein UgpC [bacterium]